ncbi:formamidopyrimidine-DNA glycosylase [Thermodesulfatator indicus DSM 15286]|uniref:Formamidopyrimidine-DNA glycosylase n=1 Tax=Thermodesulfatator indicus (strain DSM 15286 / JCM 11887 / CIR29812) TaxID=667014 RepID=F8AD51_THEID|nr:DNA-formamidopyrimidine glycosylase [Thermodesulfatator indicus]AEH44783.1 formamidopyrimidine-DNA glycosylase [Thermodesulfatator indicus DSM 15286]
MPELPEVETIKNSLKTCLKGQTIKSCEVSLPKLVSPDDFAEKIKGQSINDLKRRGKVLLIFLRNWVLLVHFKLTGQLIYLENPLSPPPYTHIEFSLEKGKLYYADLRQFGRLVLWPVKELDECPLLKKLGPEPFELNIDTFFRLLNKSSRKIKTFLLDQEKITGLGNIYVDESLFRAGVHPERPANSLSFEEAQRLLKTIKEILNEAINLGGSSVRNYVDGHGESGRFQEKHLVYGRRGKPCPKCQKPLAYAHIAGRGTTFCPYCQK